MDGQKVELESIITEGNRLKFGCSSIVLKVQILYLRPFIAMPENAKSAGLVRDLSMIGVDCASTIELASHVIVDPDNSGNWEIPGLVGAEAKIIDLSVVESLLNGHLVFPKIILPKWNESYSGQKFRFSVASQKLINFQFIVALITAHGGRITDSDENALMMDFPLETDIKTYLDHTFFMQI